MLINRDFARLWCGQAISLIGDYVFDTTILLWVATGLLRGRPYAPLVSSGILLVVAVSATVAAPLAGVLVDRWDKHRTMLGADLIRFVLIGALAVQLSVWEIWGCLLTGGHLICVPYWTARAPEKFHRLLADRQVTVLSRTPSAFAQLQDTALPEPAGLAARLVVFGGEPLDESGERVYRSGDRGRLHPDGHLDHLGRLDNQVQLRGYRIELDEIRAVLLDMPGVHAAAVVSHPGPPDTPGAARLDAYVTLAEGSRDRGADIRRRAARILPDYMVPSTVTVVSALPLTANGKVDVPALPAPDTPTGQHDERPEPAVADETTAATVRVWNTVFATEVGVDDDFFELGGNSLLAVRIGAAQRAAGLPPISPRDLYRNPTIAGLVAVLANAGGADDPSN